MSRYGFYDDGFVKDEWNEPSPWAKQETKYKVGDKVKVRSDIRCNTLYKGETGNVIAGETTEDFAGKILTIEKIRGGYYYVREDPIGIWVAEMFEPIEEQHKKIIITTDGKTTTARLYDGKTLKKEAVAKCHPDDEFDFEKGADYAFKRLFKTYYTGKVVCSKAWSGPWTVGKIYPIVDGIIHNDNGQDIDEIKSVDDLNREFFPISFIELVEE